MAAPNQVSYAPTRMCLRAPVLTRAYGATRLAAYASTALGIGRTMILRVPYYYQNKLGRMLLLVACYG
eukprot:3543549-Rhodomonas_salina.1